MNYAKLNEKKTFVKGKLIVGIDIAKKKHFAVIMHLVVNCFEYTI
ncbi:MAG: hypothetical protein AB9903_18930 [Vulcanimicrobiota bacterium]